MQGYGTVRFTTKEDAEKAITDFHGTDLEGRTLAVKIDKCASVPLCLPSTLCCGGLLNPWYPEDRIALRALQVLRVSVRVIPDKLLQAPLILVAQAGRAGTTIQSEATAALCLLRRRCHVQVCVGIWGCL